MPLSSFGPFAQSYATRLPAQLNLLVFDEIGFAEALEDALARSYLCGPFLVAPVVADRRAKIALDSAAHIVTTYPAYWKRREYFDLLRDRRLVLGGETQAQREAFSKKETDSISDVLLAGDGIVTRSWAELRRLSTQLDYRPIRSRRVVAAPTCRVPHFRPRKGAQTVVVWAPELDALRASIFAIALEELRVPVVIACTGAGEGEGLHLRARFVESTDAAQLEAFLDEAAALIGGDPDDPAATIELAARGLPLAASFESGAYEYVDGLYQYDAWDFRSILHAALSALGGEPPQVRAPIPRAQDLLDDPPRLDVPAVEDPPLVSVIIPTLNRHGILPRAIDSVARQTYPNIEVVIVNDGGKPVDSIVERLARVAIVNHDLPRGGAQAVDAGLKIASGRYVVFLADDDYLFPTHLSRSIYALERTGLSVAAGMCADSYLQPGDGCYYDFIGTSIRPYRSTDPSVLRTIPVSMPAATVIRLDAARAVGEFDAAARYYSDYEWILRLLARRDVVWISHLVLNMDSRLDRSNVSGYASLGDRADDLSRIWTRHPCQERPDIEGARGALLDLYRSDAPSPMHPMHRGVTRTASPARSVYRLD